MRIDDQVNARNLGEGPESKTTTAYWREDIKGDYRRLFYRSQRSHKDAGHRGWKCGIINERGGMAYGWLRKAYFG